jgi:hypothetical protein
MISRFERENWGTPLPVRWLEEAKELLKQTFQLELDKANLDLQLYGATYPDELCLALGIFSKNEKEKDLWTSFMLSSDLNNQSKVEKVLDCMIDGFGPIMDQYFDQLNNDKDGPEYIAKWEEDVFKDTTIHYKISHENIALSIEADKWLNL